MARRITLFSYFLSFSLKHLTFFFFFFNNPAPTEISPLPLPDAFPIWFLRAAAGHVLGGGHNGDHLQGRLEPSQRPHHAEHCRAACHVILHLLHALSRLDGDPAGIKCRSEEHTSELQSLAYLVCRLLLE